jgi:hypothetical protein
MLESHVDRVFKRIQEGNLVKDANQSTPGCFSRALSFSLTSDLFPAVEVGDYVELIYTVKQRYSIHSRWQKSTLDQKIQVFQIRKCQRYSTFISSPSAISSNQDGLQYSQYLTTCYSHSSLNDMVWRNLRLSLLLGCLRLTQSRIYKKSYSI